MIRSLRRGFATLLRRRLGVPTIPLALESLAGRRFQPSLVFDVGSHQGAFARECLERWPHALVACFEPLAHRASDLRRLASSDPRLMIFDVLLGAENCSAVVLNESETASSILSEHNATGFPPRAHPMRTIDTVVHEHFGRSPDLLKLDVQGYELEVLKGAERSLHDMRVVLAELNFLDIHVGVPLVAEVVAWLEARDWVAYDICGLTRRPLDGALWQADVMFIRKHDELRADKRWQAS